MTRSELVKNMNQSIDDRIKICLGCGSTIVSIQDNTLTCKSCGRQFKIGGDKDGCSLQ